MKKLALLVAGFALGAGAGAAIWQWLARSEAIDNEITRTAITGTSAVSSSAVFDGVSTRLAALEDHLSEAAARIEELAQSQSALKQTQRDMAATLESLETRVTMGTLPTDQRGDSGGNTRAEPEYNPEREEAEFQEQMRQAMATLSEQLMAEDVDEVWSVEAMDRITQISESSDNDGSTLNYVDCRHTMCKLEATHRDLDALNTFSRSLPMALKWNSTLTMHVEDRPDGSKTSMVFISRDGYDLEY